MWEHETITRKAKENYEIIGLGSTSKIHPYLDKLRIQTNKKENQAVFHNNFCIAGSVDLMVETEVKLTKKRFERGIINGEIDASP